jgi:glycosyltransferase involved in cell wall biosynthesis
VINIASCSFIVPVKRIHLIIEALSKIDSINIHWTHIGDGSEREYIESLANNLLGGKKNIIYQFIGFLDNESVKKVYNENHFDYFISTTESEGLPVSMMEAISFGIPVIATAVGGVPEIVTKKTGVLLDPDNCVEELVSALYHLNNMANCEKQALRESCRRYWENNFMADRQYAKFIDGLKELLYKD